MIFSNANQQEKREYKRKCKADGPPKGLPMKKKASIKNKWQQRQGKHNDDARIDIDSGDESDGRSALRGAEAGEEPIAARHGTGNSSMQHFHDPTVLVDRTGQKRWEFRCRFCAWYVNNSVLSK